jgi:CheY-like chemotaxis protein
MTQGTGYIKVNGNLVLHNGERIPGALCYSGKEFKGFIPHEHDYRRGLLFVRMYEPHDPSFMGLNALFPGGWIDEPDVPISLSGAVDASPQIQGIAMGGRTMKRVKILIVEDHGDEREILCEYLTAHNYSVFAAKTSEEAYEIACQHMPDVILMDVALPAKSGIDLCQQLKTSAPLRSIPVILLTGLDEINHKLQNYFEGAKQWLTKPSELKNVEMCIHRAMRRSDSNRKSAECSREGLSSSGQISFVFEEPSSANQNPEMDEC